MKELTANELKFVTGGISLNSSIIKAFVNTFESILEAGRNFGSSIRRLFSNNLCPL